MRVGGGAPVRAAPPPLRPPLPAAHAGRGGGCPETMV
eukprot:gene6775-34424_t